MPVKLKYDFVYNFFKEKGCELLETEYVGTHTKMRYICECGDESVISYNKFQRGNRCAKCAGNEKHTYEEVYKAFASKGYELLETEYVNIGTKMRYKCECGNVSEIRFYAFKRGSGCKKCQIENNSGENHYRFKKDRSRLCRTTYLSFDLKKLHILKDDPNYDNHLQSKHKAQLNPSRWAKSEYAVDHIFPRVAFIDNNLDNIHGGVLIKEICNLRENLRIINRKDNQTKAGKYSQEDFLQWFNNNLNKKIKASV
jgi:hypothetical protein